MPKPTLRWELVYDLVAVGMWLYSNAAFRVRVLGPPLGLEPGHLVVSTHRQETDVPIICSIIFFRGGLWRRHHYRLNFAAREDLFDRGALAALAPSAPMPVRRALYRFDPSPYLPNVRMNPIRSRSRIRYAQALTWLPPETPLDGLLPAEVRERLAARAAEHGLAEPRTAREALRAEFAELLWETAGPDELDDPRLGEIWRARADDSTVDIRRLVEVLRRREPMLLFPEGRPSPDGAIGPLQRGLRLLVRYGRVERLVPLALAYDPLTPGRPRVYLRFGPELEPPRQGLDEGVLAALRRAMPLTCGQVAAYELLERAGAGESSFDPDALDAALARAVGRCDDDGRETDPALRRPVDRRARVAECVASLVRRGLVAQGDHGLELASDRVLADRGLLRLAREYMSTLEQEVPGAEAGHPPAPH